MSNNARWTAIEAVGRGTDPAPCGSGRSSTATCPRVLSIERRAFDTPWSLAMFVLELSKPSGICLAASNSSGLVGYLVCSRYADVWHLMNVAVDPRARRAGIATQLIQRAVLGCRSRMPATRSRCRTSNSGAIAMYERFGFAPPATAAATTTTTARTR